MIDELEQLKRLLWLEWDPIGVNDMPDAEGEYDSYAHQVFSMLKQGKSKADMLAYLEWVETEYIGLGLCGRSPAIVDRIFEIHRSAK